MSGDHQVSDLLFRPDQGEGEATQTDMTIIADAEDLGGFSIMQGVVPAKGLLAPHQHDDEDQAIYVISGSLEMEVGGAEGLRFTAPQGSYVLKPCGVSHAFWNTGDADVVYIELNGGPRFAGFVRANAEGTVAATDAGPAEFGMRFYPERILDLMEEHDLTRLASADIDEVRPLLEQLRHGAATT